MDAVVARHRRIFAMAAYSVVVVMAFALAVELGAAGRGVRPSDGGLALALAALVGLRLISHRLHRLLTSRWRFVGPRDVARLVSSVSLGSVVFAVLDITGLGWRPLPFRVIALEWFFTIFLTSAGWIGYRLLREEFTARSEPKDRTQRVVIVGAGEAGGQLGREIQRGNTGMRLLAYVDDDPLKVGTYLLGVRVEGTTVELGTVVERYGAERVIIAAPSAGPADLRRMVEVCQDLELEYRVLPGTRAVLEGDVSVGQLRKVTIDDLLGRAPVDLDLPELRGDLEGACVLVSGAAGSIGSELARQIAANSPGLLVLVDQAESDLFFVEMEIRDRYPDLTLVAVVGDVREGGRMRDLIARHGVSHVYHAAAYKHVPLMEANASEAVRNNVGGTRALLDAAGGLGVRRFVLVSTDKAVRPSNVMGATKRVCEMLLLDAVERYADTSFTAVRFGNVLGSNGSVIPIFERQLPTGRLTVTHPDVTRYFMTIPEAVQLVLLAGMSPEASGRIVMLEMGQPVRIIDLARNMIRLSGLKEGRDVEIRITGLRPGEKLHEELVSPEEKTVSTGNGRIRLVESPMLDAELGARVDGLLALSDNGADDAVRDGLLDLVEGTAPTAG